MRKFIDLHIHTNLSDGSLSPKEIIDEAVKNNVSTIAIADHDTIDAYTDELYNYAESKNIKIINAVEISTKNERVGIHVLGYNLDINNEELKKKLYILRNSRHVYLHDVGEKLKNLGYFLNIEKLDKIEVVTKAHIALDVVSDIKNEKLLLKTFGYIPSKGEFIENIMNEGCPAYVGKIIITPKEAVDLIKNAGGKAILAHPVAYQYIDNFTDKDILGLIKETNVDGIESNYIFVDQNKNKINDSQKWNNIAKKNNLITTIGSDFHNKDGIHPIVGLINEDIVLNNDEIEKIINNIIN